MNTPQTKQDQSSATSDFNAMSFLVRQMLNKVNVATLVKIVAVTNNGDVSPVGLVDVQPLVNQLTGANVAVPHLTVYNVPYMRMQGGTNAIILDPQVGDIGVCVFGDRDLSSVKANKGQANPGSKRRNSYADALYIGGMLNAAPEQYVQFSDDGITVVSPTKIKLLAPMVEVQCEEYVLMAAMSAMTTTAIASVTATTSADTIAPIITNEAATSFGIVSPITAIDGNVTVTGGLTDSTGTGNITTLGQMRLDFDAHTHIVTGIQTGTGAVTTNRPVIQE